MGTTGSIYSARVVRPVMYSPYRIDALDVLTVFGKYSTNSRNSIGAGRDPCDTPGVQRLSVE